MCNTLNVQISDRVCGGVTDEHTWKNPRGLGESSNYKPGDRALVLSPFLNYDNFYHIYFSFL